MMMPWMDRAGRLSLLKLSALLLLLLPGLVIAYDLAAGEAGPKPLTFALHATGDWAIRILLATLAITPLRRIAGWNRLILLRRMTGLASLGYAFVHLCLYVLDQGLDLARIASEILLRLYLLIGFIALMGLIVLGATSTDAAIRRLGKAWNRLHRLVYPITVLGLAHYFMQSKIDVSQPTLLSGLFLLLMAYRGLHRLRQPLTPLLLAVVAILGGLATMALEVGWYATATGVSPSRILMTNFNFMVGLRPSWLVLLAGLLVAALAKGSYRAARAA